MVNISKRQLSEEILVKIFELFFKIITKSRNKESFLEIINDFLTPKEKILLAKRITIIYLLIKEVEQCNIAKILNVSTATVSKYALIFQSKESRLIDSMRIMAFKEKTFNFIDDFFADLIIQPGLKLGHWDLYWKHKKKKYRRDNMGL